MIAFLRGRPAVIGTDHVVIDVGGVGYKVFVPIPVVSSISGQKDDVTVFTYLNVREDAMQLYGFLDEKDLEVFEMLIQISGIGPKVALAVLSAMSAQSLIHAVVQEQISILTGISGVGKKTAQRLIIELKDKLEKMSIGEIQEIPAVRGGISGYADDALQGLIALGYNQLEAKRALGKVVLLDGDKKPEVLLKLALKELSK
jgi:Holliday junction DNA helicase RuvA